MGERLCREFLLRFELCLMLSAGGFDSNLAPVDSNDAPWLPRQHGRWENGCCEQRPETGCEDGEE